MQTENVSTKKQKSIENYEYLINECIKKGFERDYIEKNIFHLAIYYSFTSNEMFELLRGLHSENIDVQDKIGNTPMMELITRLKFKEALYLFNTGANPNIGTKIGLRPIDILILHQDKDDSAFQLYINILRSYQESPHEVKEIHKPISGYSYLPDDLTIKLLPEQTHIDNRSMFMMARNRVFIIERSSKIFSNSKDTTHLTNCSFMFLNLLFDKSLKVSTNLYHIHTKTNICKSCLAKLYKDKFKNDISIYQVAMDFPFIDNSDIKPIKLTLGYSFGKFIRNWKARKSNIEFIHNAEL